MCMTKALHILLSVFLLCTASCSTTQNTRDPQSVASSIVTKKYKWSKSKVSVCFIDSEKQFQNFNQQDLFVNEASNVKELVITPISGQFKADIKAAVESSFNTQKTGLQFVGWNDCGQSIPDVAIVFSNSPNDNTLSVSEIGDPAKKHNIKKINLVRLNSGYFLATDNLMKEISEKHQLEKPNLIKMINDFKSFQKFSSIAHEFGHLAGLHHEHFREDHAEALKNIDLTFDSTYAQNLLATTKMSNLNTDDFLVVSEFDPFSAMNYMRNSNYAALEIAINCHNNKYANYSTDDLKHICNFNYLNQLIMRKPGENYLSTGDIYSLKILYKNAPQGNKNQVGDQPLYQWTKTTKVLVEKYQLKFPLTLQDKISIDVPKEALYCSFNQESQNKIIRILMVNNELARAWYHQSTYEKANAYNYGYEFDSIRKNSKCDHCYDLAANYNGIPFKTSVELKNAGLTTLKIEDLNAQIGCLTTDVAHYIYMVKQLQESFEKQAH